MDMFNEWMRVLHAVALVTDKVFGNQVASICTPSGWPLPLLRLMPSFRFALASWFLPAMHLQWREESGVG
jgi:hypothetical protein